MTMRDVFAASILTGQFAAGDVAWNAPDLVNKADTVWQIADIMVSRREIEQPPLAI